MQNIGLGELLIILLIVLLFVGAKRLELKQKPLLFGV